MYGEGMQFCLTGSVQAGRSPFAGRLQRVVPRSDSPGAGHEFCQDEPHRSTMRRRLEGDGYQVVEARDGEEALTWSCPHWVDTSS